MNLFIKYDRMIAWKKNNLNINSNLKMNFVSMSFDMYKGGEHEIWKEK